MPTAMHPDVKSLLDVQQDDLDIYALEDRLASLAPRLAALEQERSRAADAIERARKAVEAEEARHREAKTRIETHRQLAERSQRQYEGVTNPREAAAALAQLEQTQAEARSSLAADRAAIESELSAVRARRDEHARAVPRPMLGTYEKVRRRRHAETVFPLRGPSCGSCDTAIPTQRRASMASTGSLEMCEGCGALLYAGE
jgi:predicted  nucleic acid-binding Zn-ribbon protein